MTFTPPPSTPTSPHQAPRDIRYQAPSYLKSYDSYNPQFKLFPLDISCLSLLPHRRQIFSEVLQGKAATTKKIEYLVELRFLVTTLKGWIEIAFGR